MNYSTSGPEPKHKSESRLILIPDRNRVSAKERGGYLQRSDRSVETDR